MKKSPFYLLLIICTLLLSGCSPGPQQREFILIGALLPLTGDSSDEGLRALNGIHLAKEEINARGGISGKMLDIIVLSDRGDREFIVEQYYRLIEKDVAAIIGSSYSVPTMALAAAAERDGIPIISPTASNPAVTQGRSNVFRAIFIDDYQAELMAYFAYNSLNARTAVVFSNHDYDTYVQACGVFAEAFRAQGGHIMAIESFSSEDDFPYLLERHAGNPPDLIFCPEDFFPAAVLVNTAYELGFRNTYLLGTDAWDGILAYVFNPEAMINAYYSAPFSFDDPDERVVRFVRSYFDSFAQMPLAGSATAYTSLYILAEAIEKAGNTNWDDIVFAMKTIEFDTVLGNISFDENNNPYINVYVIQIRDGQYSAFERLSLYGGS